MFDGSFSLWVRIVCLFDWLLLWVVGVGYYFSVTYFACLFGIFTVCCFYFTCEFVLYCYVSCCFVDCSLFAGCFVSFILWVLIGVCGWFGCCDYVVRVCLVATGLGCFRIGFVCCLFYGCLF